MDCLTCANCCEIGGINESLNLRNGLVERFGSSRWVAKVEAVL